MGLHHRSRTVLHTKLTDVVGDEEAVSDMLSQFPSTDLETPATKDFVRAESAITRTELRTEMATLSTDLRTDMATIRTEMVQMETRLMEFVHTEVVTSMRWTVGMFLTVQTIVIALILAFT